MPFANNQRITRRRSSAGPTPPKRPIGNNSESIVDRLKAQDQLS